ncbi:MAG: hypothetical protein QF752_14870 [Planctomycetota bacterium]|nr:hypothetical protein [Planctomycetota bacterium]
MSDADRLSFRDILVWGMAMLALVVTVSECFPSDSARQKEQIFPSRASEPSGPGPTLWLFELRDGLEGFVLSPLAFDLERSRAERVLLSNALESAGGAAGTLRSRSYLNLYMFNSGVQPLDWSDLRVELTIGKLSEGGKVPKIRQFRPISASEGTGPELQVDRRFVRRVLAGAGNIDEKNALAPGSWAKILLTTEGSLDYERVHAVRILIKGAPLAGLSKPTTYSEWVRLEDHPEAYFSEYFHPGKERSPKTDKAR